MTTISVDLYIDIINVKKKSRYYIHSDMIICSNIPL